ncbi:MAG: phage holin family protein [Negativicutes bacterium]|nr:phage holin family protein [Negativicutes bacterium]
MRIAVQAALLLAADKLAALVGFDSWRDLLLALVVINAVGGLVTPIVKLLARPFSILTLGLFGLLVELVMGVAAFYLALFVTPGMHAGAGLRSLVAALALSLPKLFI